MNLISSIRCPNCGVLAGLGPKDPEDLYKAIQCIRDLKGTLDEVMPQMGGIVIQDYERLNNGMFAAEEILVRTPLLNSPAAAAETLTEAPARCQYGALSKSTPQCPNAATGKNPRMPFCEYHMQENYDPAPTAHPTDLPLSARMNVDGTIDPQPSEILPYTSAGECW